MKKNERIEEMTRIVKENASKNLADDYVCTVDDDIIALVNAGYGNVEKELTEFAEILKSHFHNYFESQFIDETLRRFLKDE